MWDNLRVLLGRIFVTSLPRATVRTLQPKNFIKKLKKTKENLNISSTKPKFLPALLPLDTNAIPGFSDFLAEAPVNNRMSLAHFSRSSRTGYRP